jgi:hypothetical protein
MQPKRRKCKGRLRWQWQLSTYFYPAILLNNALKYSVTSVLKYGGAPSFYIHICPLVTKGIYSNESGSWLPRKSLL